MATRLKIGDVIEVRTAHGLRYAQYTHYDRTLQELVRILPGFYVSRPADLGVLVNQPELCVAFLFLKYFVSKGLVQVVGHEEVPNHAKAFPLFRAPGIPDRSGRILGWWLWDGQREWRVNDLAPELQELPIRETWSYPLLVRRLEDHWTPATDEEWRRAHYEEELRREAERWQARKESQIAKGLPLEHHTVRYYLYFPEEAAARDAAASLIADGFTVEVRLGADDRNWLALASTSQVPTGRELDVLTDQLEHLAASLGGEYDGWELETY